MLAGVLSALKITGVPLSDQRLMFAGAGASAQGIANLFVSALVDRGLTKQEAQHRVWMVDSRGLVAKGRQGLEESKRTYAHTEGEVEGYSCEDPAHISLAEAVANARPTILIGSSATPGLFTREVVEAISRCNDRPIVFPLSNPSSKAECTPEQAIE